MKHIGLSAAGLALVFLAAATADEKEPARTRVPDIRINAALLEPLGKDGRPLLQIVRESGRVVDDRPSRDSTRDSTADSFCPPEGRRGESNAAVRKRVLIAWLLELTTDIGPDEKAMIDRAWYSVGARTGPVAYFFDLEKVALFYRELTLQGKLLDGKKGDRVRMVLDVDLTDLDPTQVSLVEIRPQ